MITFYFDENIRTLIQSPGNQSAASAQSWVYFDNYNCQVYIVAGGIYQPILGTDTLTALLYQPQPSLPEQQLAIIGTPTIAIDAAGNQYFQLNVNLATTQLAALVQTPNKAAQCLFHFLFNPTDLERFSQSQDIAVTVNPDPLRDATGASPVPPGYPSNSNVFELIAHKGAASGYAALDVNGKVPAAQLPSSTAGGDMLKSVYDTNNNGMVDTCDTLVVSRVTGLGTAATQNIPTSGNASTAQVVMGNDTRLSDSRAPNPHETTHLPNGGDAIPLATTAGAGLCPPPDGTTIQITGGKLVATTTGTGDMLKSVYVIGSPTNANTIDNALAVQTHQVPATGNASGAQLVLATDTRLADSRTPFAHQSTHLLGGSDPIPLANTLASGLCPAVDNVTIQISASKLAAILATASAPGIVKPDGTTITIAGGVISAAAGGIGQHGARYRNSANIINIGAGSSFALTFDTQVFDTDAYYSAGKFTVPAGQAGYYSIGGYVAWNTVANITFEMLAVRLNGASTYPAMQQSVPLTVSGIGSVYAVQNVSGVYHLNGTDYIELVVMFGVSSGTPTQTIMAFDGSPSAWLMRIS